MSELRDLTNVFRTIQKSLRDLGQHVAAQDANFTQLRESVHALRNQLQSVESINAWMGAFSEQQAAIKDSVTALQSTISDHRREINRRIRDIERPDEVTQT